MPHRPLTLEPEYAASRLRLLGLLGSRGLRWRRIGRRGRVRRGRLVGTEFHRQQQIRVMGAPAITDAEIHRLGAAEQLGIGLLIAAGKLADRTGIVAEREEAPLLRIVVAERNAGIVLDDGGAVGEQEVARR